MTDSASNNRSRAEANPQLRIRELEEIEKMRNLELSRILDEDDELHKSKDKRIRQLDVDLWHANRRADDLDRRWNELAQSYEQIKADLERTGAELVRIQSQRSYRLLLKTTSVLKGQPFRTSLRRLPARSKGQS